MLQHMMKKLGRLLAVLGKSFLWDSQSIVLKIRDLFCHYTFQLGKVYQQKTQLLSNLLLYSNSLEGKLNLRQSQ